MSHIVEARTAIKLPVENPGQLAASKALLEQAVRIVAGQYEEGQVTNEYRDWYNRPVPAELAVFVKGLNRGMGVEVDKTSGELKFVGDFFLVHKQAEELQNLIAQTYITLAVKQAVEAQGYITTALEGEQGQVVLKGVAYA